MSAAASVPDDGISDEHRTVLGQMQDRMRQSPRASIAIVFVEAAGQGLIATDMIGWISAGGTIIAAIHCLYEAAERKAACPCAGCHEQAAVLRRAMEMVTALSKPGAVH